MRTIGFILLYIIVIYLAINYAKNIFYKDKTKIIVKNVPLDISFNDYFKERALAADFGTMFGINANELNLINSNTNNDEKKIKKKVFVPQRFFVNI
jgi:hypothetical protein